MYEHLSTFKERPCVLSEFFPVITEWSRVLKKLIATQLIKKFPSLYETQRFDNLFIRACLQPVFWARWVQSIPSHPISLRSILIILFYLYLGLLLWSLPFVLPNQNLVCFSHLLMYWPYLPPQFDNCSNIAEEYKLWSISLCNGLQLSVTSSLLDPSIFLRTLFLP